MKKIFTLLCLLVGMSMGLLSQAVISLTPEAAEGHFEMGREYITLQNDHVQVELGYDGLFEGYLVFDVVVINGTSDPLSIDPSIFHYLLLDSAEAESSILPPFDVVPSEKIMRLYDHVLETHSAEKRRSSFFGFIETSIGVLASTSAFLSTENPGYLVDGVFSTIGTAGHYVGQNKEIGKDLEQIHSEMEEVSDQFLRSGEIPPAKAVSGFVFFPIFEESCYIMVCIPLEDQEFQFVYKQEQQFQ